DQAQRGGEADMCPAGRRFHVVGGLVVDDRPGLVLGAVDLVDSARVHRVRTCGHSFGVAVRVIADNAGAVVHLGAVDRSFVDTGRGMSAEHDALPMSRLSESYPDQEGAETRGP